MFRAAARHGGELQQRGFSVNQVVHDYGDLCQTATQLALERRAPVSIAEFRILNRCLDDAIAEAVSEFGAQRDRAISKEHGDDLNERLGFLAHELRNHLNTAILAFAAIKLGGVGYAGATSAVLDRSLLGLRNLIDRALVDVRLSAGKTSGFDDIAVDAFFEKVQVAASLDAKSKGCEFRVLPVEPGLIVHADMELLYAAASNLLQNAFKYSRPHGPVSLGARAAGDRVLIEVADACGGLPEGVAEVMFRPFERGHSGHRGVGLGLSISRRAVDAIGGTLSVRDIPGTGCVFTIDLPRRKAPAPT